MFLMITQLQLPKLPKSLTVLIDTEEMKGIKTTSITNWLIKINMLEYFADENGIQLGITTQERLGCTVHIKSFYMTAMSNNLYLTI